MKRKATIIEFPVFNHYVVHVEIAKDLKKAMVKYPAAKPATNDLEDVRAIVVHKHDTSFSYMFFKPNPNVGTIAHECYHVVRRMLNYVGCEDDNEVTAYHLEYLVRKVTKFIRGKKV
jgi:hypothetical protein